MGCGVATNVSTSKGPGPPELAEGLPRRSPAPKKALEKCRGFPRCQWVEGTGDQETECSFRGLLTSLAIAVGWAGLTKSVVRLFHGKLRVRGGTGLTPWRL